MEPTLTQTETSKNGLSTQSLEARILGHLFCMDENREELLKHIDDSIFTTYRPVLDSMRFFWSETGEIEPDQVQDDLMRNGYTELIDEVARFLMDPSEKPFTDLATLEHLYNQIHSSSISLVSVTEKEVTYVWPKRIPRGKITIFAGVQGGAKTLTCMDIAAKISAGITWPDGAENTPGNVLLMSGEDDLGDTIKPRLRAAHADLSRVFALQMITKPNPEDGKPSEHIPTLTEDLGAIRREIQIRKPKLLIIDPVNAFLPGVDTHRDADLRSKVFAPLKQMAETENVAVIGIMHLNKAANQSAIHRVSGSIAYTAAARAAYLFTEDKNQPGRKLVLPLKFNVGPKPDGLAFKVMQDEEGLPIIAWEKDAVDIDADEALKPDNTSAPERAAAEEFLLKMLSDGPVDSSDIWEEADAFDISKSTLKRAKDKLNITAEAVRKEGKPGVNHWVWKLPE